jgi:hypothetical protein
MPTSVRIRPPSPRPPLVSDSGGGGSGWVFLTEVPNDFVAHVVQGRLESEGIEVFLRHNVGSPGAFLKPFGDQFAPVGIFVKRMDFERASMVLLEVDHGQSSPVQVGPARPVRLWLIGTLGVLLVGIILIFDLARYVQCTPEVPLVCRTAGVR